MFKNALISVSDKTGLIEFLDPFVQQGLRLVSTGGTYKYLQEAGFPVVEISEQTGFPEVMGGRVKTLHPRVHMALLARASVKEDFTLLEESGLQAFDLLICNLYPFEESVKKGLQGHDLIEKIDIGGPSMLRAAAKNFERMTVICDCKDYDWVAAKKELNLQDRKQLAARVFAHTAAYDTLVAQEMGAGFGLEHSYAGRKGIELRYGENPHQPAYWYSTLGNQTGLHSAEILQGKPLSYNNILDLDAAAALVQQLEKPGCVAVKHNNPCGVGESERIEDSVRLATQADPISVFGGIIALNRPVNAASAQILADIFLECIVAPDFSTEALAIFEKKKNLRLLKWSHLQNYKRDYEGRTVAGGFLMQKSDNLHSEIADWKYHGEKPTPQVMQDLRFAEKVCASLKSNAIAIVSGGQTLGMGMGQVNRVEAVGHAVERMAKHHGSGLAQKTLVLASDAFFPFPDSLDVAAKAGVKWMLQPGGSVKDDEVFKRAQELKINMVVTGQRHFRH